MAVASLLASRFLAIDILYLPSALAISVMLIAAQVARLWRADGELTRLLIESAGTSGSQGNDGTSSRLLSGLKLLETELALSEAIVFQLHNGLFAPVARLRTGSKSGSDSSRN